MPVADFMLLNLLFDPDSFYPVRRIRADGHRRRHLPHRPVMNGASQ